MRRLIYNAGVSADGFIAGPVGEFDWLFTDQDYGISEFIAEIDCTVMGRKSFEIINEHDKAFFDQNENYVFTRNPQAELKSNAVFVSDEPARFVNDLKLKNGRSIWLVGGGQLAGTLLDAGLIDEMLLSYHPVVLGKGIPLFRSEGGMQLFETTGVKTFDTGLVQIRYSLSKIH